MANIAMRTGEIREPLQARCAAEAKALQEQQQRERVALENLFTDGERKDWRVPVGYEPSGRGVDDQSKARDQSQPGRQREQRSNKGRDYEW